MDDRTTRVRTWLKCGLAGFALVVIGLLVSINRGWAEPRSGKVSAQIHDSNASQSFDSLYDIVELSSGSLAGCDIALVNLLCAKGLPGAENLDVTRTLRTLDSWAARVKAETDRHEYRSRQNPAEFQNSEAYFKMIMLVTVLQQDLGVKYNPERANDPDFTDSRDLFIHGLLGEDRTGTCLSMPVLYIAVGRRLGYPLYLAQNRAHLYVKWEDEQEKLNIEATSQGIICRNDSYYATWPEPLTQSQLASGAYLRSLTAAEEFAVSLTARGHCLEDTGRLPEAHVAYALAHSTAPMLPNVLNFLTTSVLREDSAIETALLSHRRMSRPQADHDYRSIDELNRRSQQLLDRGYGPLPPTPSQRGTPKFGLSFR